jgi:hypothetical protein
VNKEPQSLNQSRWTAMKVSSGRKEVGRSAARNIDPSRLATLGVRRFRKNMLIGSVVAAGSIVAGGALVQSADKHSSVRNYDNSLTTPAPTHTNPIKHHEDGSVTFTVPQNTEANPYTTDEIVSNGEVVQASETDSDFHNSGLKDGHVVYEQNTQNP